MQKPHEIIFTGKPFRYLRNDDIIWNCCARTSNPRCQSRDHSLGLRKHRMCPLIICSGLAKVKQSSFKDKSSYQIRLIRWPPRFYKHYTDPVKDFPPNLQGKLTAIRHFDTETSSDPSPNHNCQCDIKNCMTLWLSYPRPRLDEKVLSRLAEYDGAIRGAPCSALFRVPNLKSNSVWHSKYLLYIDQSFFRCVFIFSNFHWQLVACLQWRFSWMVSAY